MSISKFTEFMKMMATEDGQMAMQPTTQSGQDLARAFSELKDVNGEAKVEGAVKKLAAFAQHKGFDVSEGDVQTYLDSLKVQYEMNPMIAAMMDSYCSSTCHIGSAVGEN
ncbi:MULTISPECIES: hypothetical protein [unclassified Anabaena]|uniref:hypothetical protein n=1 Tax=unclassified Anabaena TaxID=2619674 RepID=UPI0039C745F5